MGMGAHDVDYLGALFGEPMAVCADVRTTVTERRRDDGSTLAVDADDTSVVLLRMRNGMLATVTTTAVAWGQSFRALEVFGSAGSLAVEGPLMGEETSGIRLATVGREGVITAPPSTRLPRSGVELPKRRAAGAIRSLALMLEDWLPAFSGGPTTAPTLHDGHRVQRVVDAARASSAGAGWVAL